MRRGLPDFAAPGIRKVGNRTGMSDAGVICIPATADKRQTGSSKPFEPGARPRR
jgi:hypothetical protein